MFEEVDWSKRAEYMHRKHGIGAEMADDALKDTNRVVITPDYNSANGHSVRIIGYSRLADEVITVIVLEHDGTEYGVNGWKANAKDRRIYQDGEYPETGERDEQGD